MTAPPCARETVPQPDAVPQTFAFVAHLGRDFGTRGAHNAPKGSAWARFRRSGYAFRAQAAHGRGVRGVTTASTTSVAARGPRRLPADDRGNVRGAGPRQGAPELR